MLKRIYISFCLLNLVYWKSYDFASLPRWVHRVASCPDPNNISQWEEASHRLNCYHDLTSADPYEQAAVYHCLPSSFLNETVEFCGKNVPIVPGNCPVYNYQFGENIAASYYNCSAFMSGCPSRMFHSKNVFQYPKCLKINRKEKCFEAHVNCTRSSSNESLEIITEIVPVEQTKMTERVEYNNGVSIMLLTLGMIITLILIVVGGCVLYKQKQRLRKYFIHLAKVCTPDLDLESSLVDPNEISELELLELRNKAENKPENSDSEDSGYEQPGQNAEEKKTLLDNMCQTAATWNFNVFLEQLSANMSHQIFESIKRRLKDRKENSQDDLEAIEDKENLLNYLDKIYGLSQNVVLLQGLFLACKAPNLYDICLKYTKTSGKEMMFFEKRILEKDHTKTVFIINCPKLSSYKRHELEKLRSILASILQAQYDDILVCGVKEGCVIVTFMIRNCLIQKLKAIYLSEKQNMTCQWMLKLTLKFKIMKIIIQDDVLYMSDLLSPVEGLIAEAGLCQNSPDLEFYPDEIETKLLDSIEHHNTENVNQECPSEEALEVDQEQESLKLKDILQKSLCSMTDDTLMFIKEKLQDFMDGKSVRKMDRSAVLNEMTDMLKLQYNMDYLERILDKCGEDSLLDKIKKITSGNIFQLKTFQATVAPGPKYQTLEFHVTVPEFDTYSTEIKNLKCWVAESIGVHPGKILMTALENKPIVVTYMLKKKHSGAFLKYVETDDGQIAASRNRVDKISHNGKVLSIAKALNGTNFIHVRLRYEKSQHKGFRNGIRNATSLIGRTLGIKMEGREVFLRTVESKNSNYDNKGESQMFIENNRSSLLKNLEIGVLLSNHEITSLLGEETISKIKDFDNRRDKIAHFLKMCEKLPNTQFEQMVLPHLRESISSPKTFSTSPGYNTLRTWLIENRETILEEMDADIIEATVNNMEDVPDEVKESWSDGSKSRKERSKIFLDFVLEKDEYLKALKKTTEENGILCVNQ
uniref:Uncharacterized protein LOC111130340 isoform X2 n=1 Tax=Crassostrea virginica TaxID=6565 RepID=A0A8B8DZL4_CRAVI|nr:uncharacterized protein LOC111130340 isoform X2 [Crassostrea virginica]